MNRIIFISILIFHFGWATSQNNFSFVFLPDLHLKPDTAIDASFNRLEKQIIQLNPDFILTGGDQIYTAKNGDEKNAKILFDYMDSKLDRFKMPVYYTMGNHEVVGILPDSGIDPWHPQWGKRMYEQRYGKSYKSFDFSGWNFFLLDGIKILEEELNYKSGVDSIQMLWIKDELASTGKKIPIVISIHTPLVSPKAMTVAGIPAISKNAEAVLNLFEGYNLKIVLQGHNHMYMNLFIHGVHFISGGSTSYSNNLTPFNDGFIQVIVKDNKEEIQFIQTNRPIKILRYEQKN